MSTGVQLGTGSRLYTGLYFELARSGPGGHRVGGMRAGHAGRARELVRGGTISYLSKNSTMRSMPFSKRTLARFRLKMSWHTVQSRQWGGIGVPGEAPSVSAVR